MNKKLTLLERSLKSKKYTNTILLNNNDNKSNKLSQEEYKEGNVYPKSQTPLSLKGRESVSNRPSTKDATNDNNNKIKKTEAKSEKYRLKRQQIVTTT